jgi:DNA polymerase-3 subunit epsilon
MRQVVLDTETTGLETRDDHRIIEIGCLELEKRRPTGRTLHFYLNPEREIDQGALEVHGIDQDFLADKPVFPDVVDELMHFIAGAELVIHNAPFDTGFLDHELRRMGRSDSIKQHCTIFDTLQLAKRQHPGQKNTLDALCRRYGVDNSQRELHGALLDAQLLADVYLLMTGGQTRLFQGETGRQTTQGSREQKRPVAGRSPRVLAPLMEEMQLHQQYLEEMGSKGNIALWLEPARRN